MKNFLKLTLANFLALCIFLFLFLGGLFLIIGLTASSSEDRAKVQKNSILVLDESTQIIDSPNEDIEDFLSNNEGNKILLADILTAIENAKHDKNIKGISIEADFIEAGYTQLDNIREAIEDFKKSGKFVLGYGNMVSQNAYYLSSVADKFYLHPAGNIELKGLSAEIIFYKDFMEKYGVGMDIIRYGKYKAAVEPLTRNNLSEENKEQLGAIIGDIWTNISSKISQSRKIPLNDLNLVTDSLFSFVAENNIKYKLADQLIQKSEYNDILKNKISIPKDEKLNKISIYRYFSSLDEKTHKDKIGVLYASGTILNGKGHDNIHSKNFIKEIKKLSKNEAIKAVVLRINSPGGSANASDEILFELSELKKKKPLIVSFGDVAASGGYYIAMEADKIFAQANTITGSIGVYSTIPNFKNLSERNGIFADNVQTNANAQVHSVINGLSSGTTKILEKSIAQTYKRFTHFVGKNRKMTFEQVDNIGQGRIWTGKKAKEIGLVDEIGSLQNAIKFAAQKANISEYEIKTAPNKRSAIDEFLETFDKEKISTQIIKQNLPKEHYQIFEKLNQHQKRNEILMEIPFQFQIK